MTRAVAALALAALLAGCGSPTPTVTDTPGSRLERAALRAGLVADPASGDPVGSWAAETDRLCIVPQDGGALRIGAVIDYGEGQGCAAAGVARRRGSDLAIAFGPCRFDARFEGDRIVFPAALPAGCDRYCTGRATLDALTVERLSASRAEAATLRTPSGKRLCTMGE
ncbi:MULTISPECIES: hypothetical protein [Sphingomonas]|uniref:DUF3617 family protein n=1 Tax=Sphingomonas kyungheensis TaxID=1069987 RepID=A0ABU8H294_9SPHN|nr:MULTISPECIES: hypothetical protein [unclassified Sphingomonas]EZP56710.1 hypothetical protein BW41_00549 [Sphingomonas sp. RIT328]